MGFSERSEYATAEEVLLALSALSRADLLRLHRIAGRLGWLPLGNEAQDLVSEAIEAALSGARGGAGRRWRRDVPFKAHLIMTIRGIASDLRRSFEARKVVPGEVDPDCWEGPSIVDASLELGRRHNWERRVREVIEALKVWFERDYEVLWIIAGLEDGMPAREIRVRFGITELSYDSARKRLCRALKKLRPGGQS